MHRLFSLLIKNRKDEQKVLDLAKDSRECLKKSRSNLVTGFHSKYYERLSELHESDEVNRMLIRFNEIQEKKKS